MNIEFAELSTATEVSADSFKSFAGSFPTGVTVVTWDDPVLGAGGMTVNAFASISMDPPLIMVSLADGSRATEAVLRRGTFGVNILAGNGSRAAMAFARRDTAVCAQFSAEAGLLGNPWLVNDAVAYADCEVDQAIVAGDHTIIIGRVRQASHTEQAPLGYLRRTFAPWVWK
ncbi:MAG: flavin reductase family protein [Arthrobacter sp.]|nr:flavin reductase family protein [Arthrobacter sp.]